MKIEINAKKRDVQGSSASRRLRRASQVPGIVYGGEAAPASIVFDHNELYQAMRKEAFHSSVLTLAVDGAKELVLLRDYQMHAYKPQILHVDFQRVDAKQKLHTKVPFHFVNADLAPGVKLSGGIVSHVMNEVEVECLPADLPEFIEVDLKDLNAGHSIHVSDLKLPKGVKPVLHTESSPVVATILAIRGGAADEAAAEAPAA
ncbi:large subunit ribosomal protein L25 [Oryzomicrobium terrae]|uniref:Large ribosomal subunit protein bL25 n=1 Tax=Oryzomicrobium terrae TaxID=1735038 RepID=A0A5C1E6F6_9RHOO|nr:50S ribosomal protein L25/general stress protein Ctc [Oryzomicrobium terrae]QEL63887.1 large subunit ribosomal protein L25 [Oryzomicrobium terrae]